jgi:ferrous iron transport protein A
MPQTLDSILLDQLVEIVAITENAISPKLIELGMTKGQKIKAVFKAPFGDPIAYELNGNLISMRKEEAQQIEVILS